MRLRADWRWSAALVEAFKNIGSLGSRAYAALLLAIVAGSGLAILHTESWANLDRTVDAQRSLGRDVVLFGPAESNSSFGISVGSCDSLTAVAGVQRSGTVVPMGFDDILQFGAHIPVLGVSGSLLTGLRDADAVVGTSLAHDGVILPLPGHVVAVSSTRFGSLRATVGSRQPVGIPTNGSLSVRVPAATSYAPTCVAQLERFADRHALTPVLEAQLVTRGGRALGAEAANMTFDVVEAFRARPEQWVDLYVGAICGVICALLCRFLGSEGAAYRLSGTSRTGYLRLLLIEQTILAGALAMSALLGEAVLGVSGSRLGADLGRELSGGLVWIGSFGVASLSFVFIAPTKLAKNR